MITNADLLEANHIARRHPDDRRWLLDDVSLDVRAGERVAIVGASGSGKTLLLRALALLDPTEEGEIRWRGALVGRDQIPGFRRQALYLHQRPALWEPTVAEALAQPFALRAYRDRRFDPQRLLPWLAQLGRDGSFLQKPTRDLSGGESQIVVLVRSVQLDPVLLMLDEPTAALDSDTSRAVETLLDRWLDERPGVRAVIWVSHDAAQARRVARRVLTMDAGRLVGPAAT